MKHIRNALCILMTAAMILLAACSSAEPAADAGADITETAAETAIQETESAEKLVLPDGIDYKGAKVRVYLEGYLSEDFNVFYTPETEIGEVVNDAACDRTRQVEEMLNIDIEYVTSAKNDMSALKNSVVSYAGEFDLEPVLVRLGQDGLEGDVGADAFEQVGASVGQVQGEFMAVQFPGTVVQEPVGRGTAALQFLQEVGHEGQVDGLRLFLLVLVLRLVLRVLKHSFDIIQLEGSL